MSFRNRILLSLTALVALFAGGVLAGMQLTIRHERDTVLAAEVDATASALLSRMKETSERLEAEGRVVAAEPRLRAVMNTPGLDPATVNDVLDEMRDAVRWDVIGLADPEGVLWTLRGTADGAWSTSIPRGTGEAHGYFQHGSDLYQYATVGIAFGDQLVGYLIAGHRLSDARVAEVAVQTLSEVALYVGPTLLAASLARDSPPREALERLRILPEDEETILGGQAFLVHDVSLGPGDLHARVLRPLEPTLRPFRRLRLALLALSALAVLMTAVVAWFLAQGLARPVAELVAQTHRLGAGDLTARVTPSGARELSRLGEAFNEMAGHLQGQRDEIASMNEAIVRQLEERKKLQAQLVFADRLASVGRLAAGVAHEINNPLAYIVSNLNFAVRELPAARKVVPAPVADRLAGPLGEIEEALEEARQGAERVRHIVRDLKTFSRGDDQDQRGPVDVRGVVDSSIKMAWHEIRQTARLEKHYGETPLVEANETRLCQVMVNLLVNAAQAIADPDPQRHEIRVTTSSAPDGRCKIEVRDTGAGIPAENLARIFDPFFTTKPVGVGTGLGLPICHGIITSLGGRIEVESRVGSGTLFRIVLPPARLPSTTPSQGVDVTEGAVTPAAEVFVKGGGGPRVATEA
jgi:signal transduction histidine kinase